MIKKLILTLQLLCINLIITEDTQVNLTDSTICKLSHLGLEYQGHIAKTESGVRCQSWSMDRPHKVTDSDAPFPEGGKKRAKNYCRNPNASDIGPWCYTMNADLKFESCAIPLCGYPECKATGPGMEYAGRKNKAVSDQKCLKWNKNRKKVTQGNAVIKVPKYPRHRFPENSLTKPRNFCRNPDGDSGGPWCFIRNSDTDVTEKQYCDIPFCHDMDCITFTKNQKPYMHYTAFDGKLAELSFGLKLWDSDSFLNASARLVLSLFALPLSGVEIEELGIGIEILITNEHSGLRYGNKDKPEYEPTRGIITSEKFTRFTLTWHQGFVSLNLAGETKPIFLAEYKTKKRLLGVQKNRFDFYSVHGTNVLWSFPSCANELQCDVHITTGGNFQGFWPLRQSTTGYDLLFHLRAFHSPTILLVAAPSKSFPFVKISLSDQDNFTRITSGDYKDGATKVLLELQLTNLLNFWEWREFSISLFADQLQIYMRKPIGMQLLTELNNDLFRKLRWFSVSSLNSIAEWSFFCVPPVYTNPPPALLPECALNKEEPDYRGTQSVTGDGLPCLPWAGKKLLQEEFNQEFKNETVFEAWNYCRDPLDQKKGTYCFVLEMQPKKRVYKKYCRLRMCKSEECKMAGTGNDYFGQLSTTRSNRSCDVWYEGNLTEAKGKKMWNGTLFPDMELGNAKDYCRNPSRDISGSWCYTTDIAVPMDVCAVRDCDKPEECIIIIATPNHERNIYILPQWKETGLNGGLHFGVKEWNPDLLDGLVFRITPQEGSDEIKFVIGADYNEHVVLFYNDELVEKKTFSHIIAAGKWTEFWMQMRRGELLLGFDGVPNALFEWKDPNRGFEPMFLSFTSIYGNPLGLYFKCDECHTENVTGQNFFKYFPIRLWNVDNTANSFNLTIRGQGVGLIGLIHFQSNFDYYIIKLNTFRSLITIVKYQEGYPRDLDYFRVKTDLFTSNNWTKYTVSFTETTLVLSRNQQKVLEYTSHVPLIFNWFSIAVEKGGWLTWSANCEPLSIDGPPRDGGWTGWSPWTCSVSCGGGEGFRTRTCANPRPNIFGKLCIGSPTSTGKCNDFQCGDLSPDTLDKIREHLQTNPDSKIVNEGDEVVLHNDKELLKLVKKESPNAYFEWTLNGIFVKPEGNHVSFKLGNVYVKNIKHSDSGVYVCMLYRTNKMRVVLKVVTLAVVNPTGYNIETRATRPVTIACNAVVLGYIYSDLTLKLYLNNKIYKDHGITTLAATNVHQFKVNKTHTGDWKCVVEQVDLKLAWTTNYVRIRVKRAPNLYTNLMEDPLTAPIFARLKSERNVFYALVAIVVGVVLFVTVFLLVYLRFCTMKRREYKRNRRT